LIQFAMLLSGEEETGTAIAGPIAKTCKSPPVKNSGVGPCGKQVPPLANKATFEPIAALKTKAGAFAAPAR
jgi:hypothetical protein